MKVWDCMKDIMDDKTKEFQCVIDSCNLIIHWEHDAIIIGNQWYCGEDIRYRLSLNVLEGDWQPVEKAVDFMTAVRSGKRVKVNEGILQEEWRNDFRGEEWRNNFRKIDVLLCLITCNDETDEVREILTGCNFIIEE